MTVKVKTEDKKPDISAADMSDFRVIKKMLSYKRPAFSKHEMKFIRHFIDQPLEKLGMYVDKYGNRILEVGENPTIMWASHTDTVHYQSGRQAVSLTYELPPSKDIEPNVYAGLPLASQSNCLGADCTTGVWLMLEMIKAGVKGLYVFHRAEEIGGLGSDYIASKTPELVENIDYCVSFDRYGNNSVITYQFGRCCSDAFGNSLSDALGMGHILDERGIFTDSANYTEVISECTNLSVGYRGHHSKAEIQDLTYLLKLRDALISADFSTLVKERDPADIDDTYQSYYSTGRYIKAANGYGPYHNSQHSTSYEQWEDSSKKEDSPANKNLPFDPDYIAVITSNPEAIATFLEEYGITTDEVESYCYAYSINDL